MAGLCRGARAGPSVGGVDTTIALVTGANKGIGFETARQLGARGVTVLAGARDEARGIAAERSTSRTPLVISRRFLDLKGYLRTSIWTMCHW